MKKLILPKSYWMCMIITILLCSGQIGWSQIFAKAQNKAPRTEASSSIATQKLRTVLNDLKSHYRVDILSEGRLVEGIIIQTDAVDYTQSLEYNLDKVLKANGLRFKKIKSDSYLILEDKKLKKFVESDVRFQYNNTSQPSEESSSIKNIEIDLIANEEVKGKVSDDKGGFLPGVNIKIKGTQKGTISGNDGSYKIEANAGDVLVFSFIGFKSQELTVNANQLVLNVALTESLSTLGEVVVVGSRSSQARTNINSAVPIDVITTKELKNFSQVDLGQILNYVAPSFNSNRQTVADGSDHVDPASLRGLGPDQVLVLVNGKRRHSSALLNINGTVGRGSVGIDMNVIPVAAIERIEVLRDGAAAQYGSDAIAGVINVVLKKNVEGFSSSLTLGQNMTTMNYTAPNIAGGMDNKIQSINDGQVIQFDFSKGFRLGKEGSLTISAQYNEHGKTNRSGEDNIPTTYLGSNGGFPTTPTGQVQNDFRKNLLVADKAIETANGYDRHNMVFGNSSSKNLGLFFNGGLPMGKESELYFSGGLTYRTGKGFGNYRPPVARNQQPLNTDGSLFYRDGFLPGIGSEVQDQSIILGYKTKLGKWNMDLSNTYGANSFGFSVFNSGNATLPNANNQQTEFDAGKLKFDQNTTNLDFSRLYEKVGSISGLNLAFGAEFRRDHYQIVAGEKGSYSGEVKNVPVAPIVANGPAYNNGTTVAAPGAQVFPGYQPSNEVDKSRTNLGLYADVEGEIANRLLVGIATRYENYSDFGSNFSNKISTRLKLTENFAFRGSASTGFRAPSLHQRYFNNTSTQFVSGLPSNTLTVNNDDPIARKTIGVDALRPETSVSYTVGLTGKIGRLSLTVDAYQIEIQDRIVYSGAFSRALLGFATTDYVGVNNVNFFANAANTRTQGIDIVANFKQKVGKGNLLLNAAINFNKNEVTAINSTALIDSPEKNDPTKSPDTQFKNLLFDRQQRSRIEVWQPKNKINLSATYNINKLSVSVRVVRFGEVKYIHNLDTEAKKADGTYWNTQFNRDANGQAYIDQTFAPVLITDLVLGYALSKGIQLSIGANNIFDVYPQQIYIDPRNAYGSLDYSSGRDASNRGRLLFQPNQGGYNGRFAFAKVSANF
ncbi:MAG: TonB-dependent receptor [Bacteroidota bacterium]